MARTPDHYTILEVRPDASDAEIKRRYRQIMRAVHPDANVDDPEANRKAARINAAYETLGDPEKRAQYDLQHRPTIRAVRRHYEHIAEQPNWEDIVAAGVPTHRPRHVHHPLPTIEPEEIEVDMAELRDSPRVRRTLRVTNRCDCVLTGNVSTSEPWLRGPVGRIVAGPGVTVEFEAEVVAARVNFPGLSRIVFVANEWTGVVPVRITGYTPRVPRSSPPGDSAYVPSRRRRAMRR